MTNPPWQPDDVRIYTGIENLQAFRVIRRNKDSTISYDVNAHSLLSGRHTFEAGTYRYTHDIGNLNRLLWRGKEKIRIYAGKVNVLL